MTSHPPLTVSFLQEANWLLAPAFVLKRLIKACPSLMCAHHAVQIWIDAGNYAEAQKIYVNGKNAFRSLTAIPPVSVGFQVTCSASWQECD